MMIMKLLQSAAKQKVDQYGNFDPNFNHDDLDISLLDLAQTVTFSELKQLFNVKSLRKGSHTVAALQQTCKTLKKKGISLKDSYGSFYEAIFIPEIKFDARAQILTMSTTRMMAACLLNFGRDKNYSLVDYELYFQLESVFAQRILDWISRFKNQKDYVISVGDLCKRLCIDRFSYATTYDFKKTVLIKPIKEIVEKSKGLWTIQVGSKYGFELSPSAQLDHDITFKMSYDEQFGHEPLYIPAG